MDREVVVTSYQRPDIPCGPVAYMELASLPTTPFWARRQTRAVLQAWLMLPDTIETAELLVSELITNATKCSAEPPTPLRYLDWEKVERISLTLRLLRDQLSIEVTDSDPNPPVLAEAELDAEGGRGLMLVDALSKEWSSVLPPAAKRSTASSALTDDCVDHRRMSARCRTATARICHRGTGFRRMRRVRSAAHKNSRKGNASARS